MKRFISIISLLSLLFSCEKPGSIVYPDQYDDIPNTEESKFDFEIPKVLHASIITENNENISDTTSTRTYVHNEKEVLWQNNDAISFFVSIAHNLKYVYKGEDGASSADFEIERATEYESEDDVQSSYGIYPHHIDNEVTLEIIDQKWVEVPYVNYPAEQEYAVNSFGKGASVMVAKGEYSLEPDLHFKNASGYLVIKLYSPVNKVKSITVKANNENIKISGKAKLILDEEGIPSVTMTENGTNSITLNCLREGEGVALGTDSDNATEFWFALPPVTIEGGINVEVTDMDGKVYTKKTTKSIEITRNEIQPMKAYEIDYDHTQLYMRYTTSDGVPSFEKTASVFDVAIADQYIDDKTGEIVLQFNTPPSIVRTNAWKGSKITSVTLASSITTIEEGAFMNTPLATANIGEGVRTIGKNAFYNSQLTSLILPESLNTIGEGAFRNTPITAITIPGNANTIGVDAFYDCSSLASVKFAPSINDEQLKIGYCITASDAIGPFYYCPLTSIDLNRELILTNGSGSVFTSANWAEGLFATKYYNDKTTVPSATVTLGSQVKKIQKYMFNWLAVTSISIPENISLIDEFAFDGCSNLSSVTIEESTKELKIIGNSPFYDSPLTSVSYNRPLKNYNTSLNPITPNSEQGIFAVDPDFLDEIETTLTIGKNITVIPEYMFANLPITEVNIKSPVYQIGNNAFIGCEKLATINIESSTDPLRIGYQTYASSEYGPFYDSPLTTINLDRELTYGLAAANIDGWEEGLFAHKHYDKKNFPSVTVDLGGNVKTISKFMFARLPIETITIPGTVNSIAEYAFDDCTRLNSVSFGYHYIPLVIKGQGTDGGGDDFDNGPFYDSPLASISFDRHFDYLTIAGKAYTPDTEAKGLFAINPEILEKNKDLTTTVTIGQNVTTIPEYMFPREPSPTWAPTPTAISRCWISRPSF